MRVNKFYVTISILLILTMILSGCSTPINSNEVHRIDGCSEKAQLLINSLKADERIDAVYEAQRIIANLNWNNEKKFLVGIEQLNKIAIKYDKEVAIERIDWLLSALKEPEKYGGMNLSDKKNIDNTKELLDYIFQDIFYLVVDVYEDQNQYDHPLNVNSEDLEKAIINSGYSHKISADHLMKYYLPENITVNSDGKEEGKGASVSVHYDRHGNIMGLSLPPLIDYGMTEKDYESFLNSATDIQRKMVIENGLTSIDVMKTAGIQGRDILSAILNDKEIKQFETFVKTFSSDDINNAKQYYWDEKDFALRYNLIFSDKHLMLTLGAGSLSITNVISGKQSQYTSDINTLEFAFNNQETKEYNDNASDSINCNVDMNSLPISQDSSNEKEESASNTIDSIELEKNEKWYEKYNRFIREDGKYLCTIWFQDDGTLGFEMDGLTVAVISHPDEDFAPNSYLYESIQDSGTYDFLYNYSDKILRVVDSVSGDENDYSGTYIVKP